MSMKTKIPHIYATLRELFFGARPVQLTFDLQLKESNLKQQSLDQTTKIAKVNAKRPLNRKSKSAVKDELNQLWCSIRASYFPDRNDIDDYRVIWSMRRQTRSLATCNVHTKKVNVAHAMNRPEYQAYLEALLYHEMCHAVLGEAKIVNGRRVIHGREFKALERRHPGIKPFDAWIKAGGWRQAVRREGQARRWRQAAMAKKA